MKHILEDMRNLPRYKKCFVCGKENPIGLNVTFKTDEEKVYAFLSFREEYSGYENRVHGGIVSGLLDEAMGWACTIKTKRLYFTVELLVKFKKPVKPNIDITVEAWFTKEKHGICSASGILKDPHGNILALATGKYYPLDPGYQKIILSYLHHEPEDGLAVTERDL